MSAALRLVVVLAAAALLVRAAAPRGLPGGVRTDVVAALALGLGAAGLSHLVWLLLLAPVDGLAWLPDLALLAAAALLWWSRRGTAADPPERSAPAPDPRAAAVVLGSAAAAALAAAAFGLLVHLRLHPHGTWDAYAVWNLRARFLFRAPAHWFDGLSPQLVHHDYPLLQPLIVARGWMMAGNDTTLVPQGLAFVATGLIAGLLLATLRALRGTVAASLAVLALLAFPAQSSQLPLLVERAASQFADSLLAAFLLGASCCLALSLADCRGSTSLALAGAFAGLAAWTKNEGKLFALALLATVFVLTAWRHGRGAALARSRALLWGLLPAAGLLLFVQASFVEESSGLFTEPAGVLVERGLTLDRHRQILAEATAFVRPKRHLAALLPLALYALAAGATRREASREAGLFVTATLAVIALGYYAVYLVTPFDLEWHLRASLPRLFFQLWPSLVLGVFLVSRTPGELRGTAVGA